MSERETKVVTTKDGKELVLKAWISGREFGSLQNVYIKGAKIGLVNGAPQLDSFDTNIEHEATKKLIEIMVVSFDGKTEGLVDTILDLPLEQYNEIIDSIKEITDKKKS